MGKSEAEKWVVQTNKENFNCKELQPDQERSNIAAKDLILYCLWNWWDRKWQYLLYHPKTWKFQIKQLNMFSITGGFNGESQNFIVVWKKIFHFFRYSRQFLFNRNWPFLDLMNSLGFSYGELSLVTILQAKIHMFFYRWQQMHGWGVKVVYSN